MPHPMHMHGHFLRIVNPNISPEYWIKKDTFLLGDHDTVHVEFMADNPGRWFHHCHNLYHMMDGMANEVVYKS
jgi:FtsP/CotA-like multicopper oxidase with cupredoxin domain